MRGEDEIRGIVVLCSLTTDPSPFADNRIGACHFCAREVKFRPHAPTPHTLVCRLCWDDRREVGDAVEVSARSRAEIADYFRRN